METDIASTLVVTAMNMMLTTLILFRYIAV